MQMYLKGLLVCDLLTWSKFPCAVLPIATQEEETPASKPLIGEGEQVGASTDCGRGGCAPDRGQEGAARKVAH